RSNTPLSCKIEYYIKTNSAYFSDQSAFFTDDSLVPMSAHHEALMSAWNFDQQIVVSMKMWPALRTTLLKYPKNP
ncbi:hypothetical protein, partial [Bradyrhizobium sp. S3.9.1]|uniref:hypothetical protein n=1 Tax=Bradyrhizobium sp. S3.9.1 TaxID=3156431 RepID=UPI003399938A